MPAFIAGMRVARRAKGFEWMAGTGEPYDEKRRVLGCLAVQHLHMSREAKVTTEPQTDPALVAMMRCYLSKPRISWPYLALLLGSMAFLVLALFLPV